MAGFWDTDRRTHTEKTRDALTPSKKTKIKQLIGKCEYCNKHRNEQHLLKIHHIIEASKADGSSDKNTPGNLIVLCSLCHDEAHAKNITKTALRGIVRGRSEKIRTELKAILKDRPIIVDQDNGVRYPSSFTMPDISYPGSVTPKTKPRKPKSPAKKTTKRKPKSPPNFWDDLV